MAQAARIAEQEAVFAARVAEQDAKIAQLEKQVAELLQKLGRNSGNSNLPPSSDGPGQRKGPQNRAGLGKRNRGGQKGHRGSRRTLLATEHVDNIVNLFPSQCAQCSASLPEVEDRWPQRHQVTELPAFEPHTTEYRRHAVQCACCQYTTRAPIDPSVIPSSPFGPRLMSAVALLTGVYHLSRRKAVQLLSDLVGVGISLGAVSAVEARVSVAVEPAVQEACVVVNRAAVKHTDGTSWLRAGKLLSLWTIATSLATVFKILPNGRADTLKLLYGKMRGILVSDRATALKFWAMERRQICWAHLLRKFVSFEERDGSAGDIGRELLEYTSLVFRYWHDYRDQKLGRDEFQAWMAPVRHQFEQLLERAAKADIAEMSGSCEDMLAHRAALWTFVDHEGVEPTNNHAERELRAFVLWRKRSFGSQSERGDRFAERLMTIAHTARKQGKNVLEFLTACCVATLDRTTPPSLFERERPAA
ncbi:MAG TPA: IS66 family transposase [Polyangiales bacterium]|nr:IS66 family transposase [Polyangiales bacterium]